VLGSGFWVSSKTSARPGVGGCGFGEGKGVGGGGGAGKVLKEFFNF